MIDIGHKSLPIIIVPYSDRYSSSLPYYSAVSRNVDTEIADAKGQLILKGLSVFFNSPKKRTKIICSSGQGKNLSYQVRFLGELETPKGHFEIT